MIHKMEKIEDMEQAVLFSRVSSKSQVSKAKFEQTLNKAKDYCKGGYANKTGEKYMLCEKQFIHVGSAFSKDIREGDAMQEILQNLDKGKFKKPLHVIFANATDVTVQEQASSAACILAFD